MKDRCAYLALDAGEPVEHCGLRFVVSVPTVLGGAHVSDKAVVSARKFSDSEFHSFFSVEIGVSPPNMAG